mgnify:FL=1
MSYLLITLASFVSGFLLGKLNQKHVTVKDQYSNPRGLKGRALQNACAVKLANEIVDSGALNITQVNDKYLISMKLIK